MYCLRTFCRCSVILLAVLSTCLLASKRSSAEVELDESAKKALLDVTPDDLENIPETEFLLNAFGSRPFFEITRPQCIGDEPIANSLSNRAWKQRYKISFYKGPGYSSIKVLDENTSSIDTINLTDQHRENLRFLIRMHVRRIEFSNEVAKWMMMIVPSADAHLNQPKKKNVSIAVKIPKALMPTPVKLTGIFIAHSVKVASELKYQLNILADQLRSEAVAYRSIVIVRSIQGKQYVRIRYGLYPSERSLVIIQTCYYARSD